MREDAKRVALNYSDASVIAELSTEADVAAAAAEAAAAGGGDGYAPPSVGGLFGGSPGSAAVVGVGGGRRSRRSRRGRAQLTVSSWTTLGELKLHLYQSLGVHPKNASHWACTPRTQRWEEGAYSFQDLKGGGRHAMLCA